MRIRTIKPEFWESEVIQNLSLSTRLLFIGLWNYVDDNGVGKESLKNITIKLFGGDYFDDPEQTVMRTHGGLTELSSAGLIIRFASGNDTFLQIVNWDEHQKINRPSKPRFPRYSANSHTLIEGSLNTHGVITADSLLEQGTGNREQGTGNISCATADADCAPTPDATSEAKPEEYSQDFLTFWAAYPIRRNKRAAWRRWKEAIKRAPAEAIIAGAQAYANDPNREDRFTKYPEGWLNGDGWEDQQLPNRGPECRDHIVNGWLEMANQYQTQPEPPRMIGGSQP